MKLVVADGLESFELQAAPLQLPLIVLLRQSSDEPDDREPSLPAMACRPVSLWSRLPQKRALLVRKRAGRAVFVE